MTSTNGTQADELRHKIRLWGEKYKVCSTLEVCLCVLGTVERRLDLTPQDDASRWDRFAEVATWRYKLFKNHSNDINDLNKAIHAAREANILASEKQEDRPWPWVQLAEYLSQRAEYLQSLSDFEEAITLYDEASAWCCEEKHFASSIVQQQLAKCLNGRYDLTSDLADLSRGIELFEAALVLTPEDSTIYEALAMLLRKRGIFSTTMSDVDRAIQMIEEWARRVPDDINALSELGATLGQRFLLSADEQDVERAVNVGRLALQGSHDMDDRTKRNALHNLSSSIGFRSESSAEPEDVEEAVQLAKLSVEIDSEDSDLVWRLHNYAIRLTNRFDHFGKADDLNTAIKSLETAQKLACCGQETESVASPAAQQILASLSVLLSRRYNNFGITEDLILSAHYLTQVKQRPESDFWLGARVLSQLSLQSGRELAIEDITQSIEEIESTLEQIPREYEQRVPYYGLLSEFYGRLSTRLNSVDHMTKSIHCMEYVVKELPVKSRRGDLALAMMAEKLRIRGTMTWEICLGDGKEDLEEAVGYITELRSRRRTGSNLMSFATAVLAKCLYERWRQSPRSEDHFHDLECAIKHFEEVIGGDCSGEMTGDDFVEIENPLLARDPLLYQLGHAYIARSEYQKFHTLEEKQYVNNAIRAFERCFTRPHYPEVDRILAASCAAVLHSFSGHQDRALDTWKKVFKLVPAISPRSMSRQDQIYMLQHITGMSRRASADALAAGAPALEALKLLELGREIIASSALEARVDLTMLGEDQAAAYRIARTKLETQRQQMYHNIPINGEAAGLAQWATASQSYRATERQLYDIITSIQSDPETETFLGLPSLDEIRKHLGDNTIVVVNACESSHAYLINNALSQVQIVVLSRLKWDEIELWSAQLRKTRPLIDIAMLRWLWSTTASPVLDKLGIGDPKTDAPLPRIIWIPTGPLTYLPIHAAGQYDGSTATVMDRVVSTYSSSLKAFVASQKQQTPNLRIGSEKVLLVGMDKTPGQDPLPFVNQELEKLSDICHSLNLKVTRMKQPQQKEVLLQLPDCSIFHFAGHGLSDPVQPENGGIILKDSTLTVSDLLDQTLQNKAPFLGFLSACLTGVNDAENVMDESIHLVSAFQLSGFRHVIGTMWQVQDKACGKVAEILYSELFTSVDQDDALARGLHKSVMALRDEWMKTAFIKGAGLGNSDDTTELNSPRRDVNKERQVAMERLDAAVSEYDDLLSRTQHALKARSASSRDIRNIRDWIEDHGCISREESKYLWKDDLMSLVPFENDSILDTLAGQVEDCVIWLSGKVQLVRLPIPSDFRYVPMINAIPIKDFRTTHSRDQNMHIFPEGSIRTISRAILAGFAAFILLAPVVSISFVQSDSARLVLIVLSNTIFVAVLSLLVRQRIGEILVAGATYAAVLMAYVKGTH
ncbi:hypothetical protein E8E14_000289 [Neopestalotiopsis sp. 37M]|nr:hypothetical protein E8E14_000289 [Neopestalotiopsis sp. 37M]